MKKQLQFELWPECNCQCSFCYLSDQNKFTSAADKLYAINVAIDKISNDSILKNYSNVSLIGGEFFQGQLNTADVRNKFFELIKLINDKLSSNDITTSWISASLLIGNQADLYKCLDILKENQDKVYITTSYDSIGRFKSSKMKETWIFHMKKIHEKYPKIRVNTTIILTQDVVQRYLNDEFTFKSFCNQYNTEVFLKHTDPTTVFWKSFKNLELLKSDIKKAMPWFMVNRSDFLKFLIKFKKQEPIDLWYKLFNIVYRADSLVQFRNGQHSQYTIEDRFKNKDIEHNTKLILKCGHPADYMCYADSDKCMLCDKLTMNDE